MLLSKSRTKRRDASWESEPFATTDATLDKHTLVHVHKIKYKLVSLTVILVWILKKSSNCLWYATNDYISSGFRKKYFKEKTNKQMKKIKIKITQSRQTINLVQHVE